MHMILVDVIEAMEKVVSGGSKRMKPDQKKTSNMVSAMQKLHVGVNPSNLNSSMNFSSRRPGFDTCFIASACKGPPASKPIQSKL